MKDHVNRLGNKSYWAHFQPAPDIVVMFVPGEALLSAALQHDAALLEFSMNKGVMLVGAGEDSTTIDGGHTGGVFTNFAAGLRISNVTIRNGQSIGSGGGITNWGTLSLTDSTVSENITSLGEGFQGFGGGTASCR